jgi:hypothetical protein
LYPRRTSHFSSTHPLLPFVAPLFPEVLLLPESVVLEVSLDVTKAPAMVVDVLPTVVDALLTVVNAPPKVVDAPPKVVDEPPTAVPVGALVLAVEVPEEVPPDPELQHFPVKSCVRQVLALKVVHVRPLLQSPSMLQGKP